MSEKNCKNCRHALPGAEYISLHCRYRNRWCRPDWRCVDWEEQWFQDRYCADPVLVACHRSGLSASQALEAMYARYLDMSRNMSESLSLRPIVITWPKDLRPKDEP